MVVAPSVRVPASLEQAALIGDTVYTMCVDCVCHELKANSGCCENTCGPKL